MQAAQVKALLLSWRCISRRLRHLRLSVCVCVTYVKTARQGLTLRALRALRWMGTGLNRANSVSYSVLKSCFLTIGVLRC